MIETKKDFINCDPVDILAHNIFNIYTEKLKENNFRIFAKNVNFKLCEIDEYELLAFKSYFKDYFKTEKQIKKTKHIKSNFLKMTLPDYFNNYFYTYLTINKKDYEKDGLKYLDRVFNYFLLEMEKKAEENLKNEN